MVLVGGNSEKLTQVTTGFESQGDAVATQAKTAIPNLLMERIDTAGRFKGAANHVEGGDIAGRESSRPRPARLGAQTARACVARLHKLGTEPDQIDPLTIEIQQPFKPQFAFANGRAPEELDALADQVAAVVTDGYVMISPEYNHSMSPALGHLLNHFGSSQFSFKPSAIVTYTAGQWRGARAAANMRTYLSELGCLLV
ncbi:MAG: NAD(P)H-dependent oxidoreductase [Pseudomonadota bacterium]